MPAINIEEVERFREAVKQAVDSMRVKGWDCCIITSAEELKQLIVLHGGVILDDNIQFCTDCLAAEMNQVPTSDSFEYVSRVYCKKLGRVVHHYLDTFDKAKQPPDCPIVASRIKRSEE